MQKFNKSTNSVIRRKEVLKRLERQLAKAVELPSLLPITEHTKKRIINEIEVLKLRI